MARRRHGRHRSGGTTGGSRFGLHRSGEYFRAGRSSGFLHGFRGFHRAFDRISERGLREHHRPGHVGREFLPELRVVGVTESTGCDTGTEVTEFRTGHRERIRSLGLKGRKPNDVGMGLSRLA